MTILSSEIKKILDKLYNLRGEDSVVLVSIDKNREKAIETKERTSIRKSELQNTINDLTVEENIMAEEGQKLITALASIHKDEFATVIKRLRIDFDPELLKTRVESTLPTTIDKIVNDKNTASQELVAVEDEMNEAIARIEELAIRKDEALSNQARLNHYFELALSSNINITRDEITSLLDNFGCFDEQEKREAAKLLMFPEDGLFEYENKNVDKPVFDKTISEVFQEAREVTPEVTPLVEETTTEPDFNIPVIDVTEEIINNDKEELIELLTNLNFDYLSLTSEDFDKLLANYDKDIITKNMELINRLNINKDIFLDNIDLLYDKEMASKVDTLMNLGKLPKDIYLYPNILIKYNLNELDSAIKLLEDSGLDPKNVPLMAF